MTLVDELKLDTLKMYLQIKQMKFLAQRFQKLRAKTEETDKNRLRDANKHIIMLHSPLYNKSVPFGPLQSFL